jgi:hypothetical protein
MNGFEQRHLSFSPFCDFQHILPLPKGSVNGASVLLKEATGAIFVHIGASYPGQEPGMRKLQRHMPL